MVVGTRKEPQVMQRQGERNGTSLTPLSTEMSVSHPSLDKLFLLHSRPNLTLLGDLAPFSFTSIQLAPKERSHPALVVHQP